MGGGAMAQVSETLLKTGVFRLVLTNDLDGVIRTMLDDALAAALVGCLDCRVALKLEVLHGGRAVKEAPQGKHWQRDAAEQQDANQVDHSLHKELSALDCGRRGAFCARSHAGAAARHGVLGRTKCGVF